jgi:hypothetical protein
MYNNKKYIKLLALDAKIKAYECGDNLLGFELTKRFVSVKTNLLQ